MLAWQKYVTTVENEVLQTMFEGIYSFTVKHTGIISCIYFENYIDITMILIYIYFWPYNLCLKNNDSN